MGTAIMMFLVKLMFLLSLINIAHSLKILENLSKVTVKENSVLVRAF